jgi:putative membrane protein
MIHSASGRKPRVFSPDDPDLEIVSEPIAQEPPMGGAEGARDQAPGSQRFAEDIGRGIRWGSILLAAGGALATLALALSFVQFVAIAFERSDWIGWIAFVLLITFGVALAMILMREIIGIVRLRRLGTIRGDAEHALSTGDTTLERSIIDRLAGLLGSRSDCAWRFARVREHARDVHDAGDLLRLVDRHVLMPLDGEARRVVAAAARRTGTVSAISPSALITVSWVLIENLRLLRTLGGVYGGRPGFVGTMRLARLVAGHIIATGGVALTDDLVGQFLGQDLLRRLSHRLGEGIFNAALTARIGAAAVDVIRPLPYLEAPPVRARDFIAEIARRRSPVSPLDEDGRATARAPAPRDAAP